MRRRAPAACRRAKIPERLLDPMLGIARLCHANSRLALPARYAMTPHISRLIARLHLLAPRRGAARLARDAARESEIQNGSVAVLMTSAIAIARARACCDCYTLRAFVTGQAR